MAVFLMGTGAQRSLRDVVSLLEKHLLRTEGVPRRIAAESDAVKLEAERPDFDQPFSHFVLTLPDDWPNHGELKSAADELGSVCTVQHENGQTRFSFVAENDPKAVEEAVDGFSLKLSIPETWRAEGDKYRLAPNCCFRR